VAVEYREGEVVAGGAGQGREGEGVEEEEEEEEGGGGGGGGVEEGVQTEIRRLEQGLFQPNAEYVRRSARGIL